jgi:uncharacterized protein (TIGR02246 family)
MSRGARSLSALLLALSLGACAPAGSSSSAADTSKDMADINTLRSDFQTAVNAGDAAKLAGLYTADAVQMLENAPAITGRDAIQKHVQDEFGQFSESMTLTSDETKIAGDWAFDRGGFMVHMMPKTAGVPMIMEQGKYIVILQKENGAWKVAREIGNSNAPMTPPPTAPTAPTAPVAPTAPR